MWRITKTKQGQQPEVIADGGTELAAVQYQLKDIMEGVFSGRDDLVYWNDDTVAQMRYEVFTQSQSNPDPCRGYEGPGWYTATGSCYSAYCLDSWAESIDFMSFGYDDTVWQIEEYSAPVTLANILSYPQEFEDTDPVFHVIAKWETLSQENKIWNIVYDSDIQSLLHGWAQDPPLDLNAAYASIRNAADKDIEWDFEDLSTISDFANTIWKIAHCIYTET